MSNKIINKLISFILCWSFVFQQIGFAQVAGELDLSAHFLRLGSSLTPVVDKFRPMHLRYLSYDKLKDNFDLLLDKGDLKNPRTQELENASKDLLNYFYIGLSLPNSSFWVNLRPDSPDNIIDSSLAKTGIGRILLEADVQLKKDTSSYTNPQTPEGRQYWDKLYQKAGELFGSEAITIPTLTRPWIVPGEIIIREAPDNAYIYKATLKVMLEEDYLKEQQGRGIGTGIDYSFSDQRLKALNEYSTQLIKELIIPKLTKEVNSSKRYAPLRQVYYSLILAQWFKAKYRDGSLNKAEPSLMRIDSQDLTNLTSKQPYSIDTYFQAYKKSFAQGEYNLKEQRSSPYGQVIRSYMSGGVALQDIKASSAINSNRPQLPQAQDPRYFRLNLPASQGQDFSSSPMTPQETIERIGIALRSTTHDSDMLDLIDSLSVIDIGLRNILKYHPQPERLLGNKYFKLPHSYLSVELQRIIKEAEPLSREGKLTLKQAQEYLRILEENAELWRTIKVELDKEIKDHREELNTYFKDRFKEPMAALSDRLQHIIGILDSRIELAKGERLQELQDINVIINDLRSFYQKRKSSLENEITKSETGSKDLERKKTVEILGGFKIESGLQPNQPINIRGNKLSISVAIADIINNAISFAKTKVIVRVSQVDGFVKIEVEDDGSGILPALLEKDQSGRQKTFLLNVSERPGQDKQGTGLGTALAWYEAIDAKGTIEAKNKVEGEVVKGAVFTVRLPIAVEPSSTVQAASPVTVKTSAYEQELNKLKDKLLVLQKAINNNEQLADMGVLAKEITEMMRNQPDNPFFATLAIPSNNKVRPTIANYEPIDLTSKLTALNMHSTTPDFILKSERGQELLSSAKNTSLSGIKQALHMLDEWLAKDSWKIEESSGNLADRYEKMPEFPSANSVRSQNLPGVVPETSNGASSAVGKVEPRSVIDKLKITQDLQIKGVWEQTVKDYLQLYQFTKRLKELTQQYNFFINFPPDALETLTSFIKFDLLDNETLLYNIGFITLNGGFYLDYVNEASRFKINLALIVSAMRSGIEPKELLNQKNAQTLQDSKIFDSKTLPKLMAKDGSCFNPKEVQYYIWQDALAQLKRLDLSGELKTKLLLELENLLSNIFLNKRLGINEFSRHRYNDSIKPSVSILDKYREEFEPGFFESPQAYINKQEIVRRIDVFPEPELIGEVGLLTRVTLPLDYADKIRVWKLRNGEKVYSKRVNPLTVSYPEEEIDLAERLDTVLQRANARFHAQKFIGIVYDKGSFYLLSLGISEGQDVDGEEKEIQQIQDILSAEHITDARGVVREKDIIVKSISGEKHYTVVDFETFPYRESVSLEQKSASSAVEAQRTIVDKLKGLTAQGIKLDNEEIINLKFMGRDNKTRIIIRSSEGGIIGWFTLTFTQDPGLVEADHFRIRTKYKEYDIPERILIYLSKAFSPAVRVRMKIVDEVTLGALRKGAIFSDTLMGNLLIKSNWRIISANYKGWSLFYPQGMGQNEMLRDQLARRLDEVVVEIEPNQAGKPARAVKDILEENEKSLGEFIHKRPEELEEQKRLLGKILRMLDRLEVASQIKLAFFLSREEFRQPIKTLNRILFEYEDRIINLVRNSYDQEKASELLLALFPKIVKENQVLLGEPLTDLLYFLLSGGLSETAGTKSALITNKESAQIIEWFRSYPQIRISCEKSRGQYFIWSMDSPDQGWFPHMNNARDFYDVIKDLTETSGVIEQGPSVSSVRSQNLPGVVPETSNGASSAIGKEQLPAKEERFTREKDFYSWLIDYVNREKPSVVAFGEHHHVPISSGEPILSRFAREILPQLSAAGYKDLVIEIIPSDIPQEEWEMVKKLKQITSVTPQLDLLCQTYPGAKDLVLQSIELGTNIYGCGKFEWVERNLGLRQQKQYPSFMEQESENETGVINTQAKQHINKLLGQNKKIVVYTGFEHNEIARAASDIGSNFNFGKELFKRFNKKYLAIQLIDFRDFIFRMDVVDSEHPISSLIPLADPKDYRIVIFDSQKEHALYALYPKQNAFSAIQASSAVEDTQLGKAGSEWEGQSASTITSIFSIEEEIATLNHLEKPIRGVVTTGGKELAKQPVLPVTMMARDYSLAYLRLGGLIICKEDLSLPKELEGLSEKYTIIKIDGGFKYGNFLPPFIAAMIQENFRGLIVEEDGIGNGLLSLIALRLGARRIVGIESNKAILSEAKELFTKAGYKVRYFTRDDLARDVSKKQDQVMAEAILIEADLVDWFALTPEVRESIAGGPLQIRLAEVGPIYSVFLNLLHDALKTYPTKSILGGFVERMGPANLQMLSMDSDQLRMAIKASGGQFNPTVFRIGEEGYFSVLTVEPPNPAQAASPVADTKGGIDFRALPIVNQPIAGLLQQRINLTPPIPLAELGKEWQEIENMLKVGIAPSTDRIKDYLLSCCQKESGGFNQEIDKVINCLADILRTEEEKVIATEPALKEILTLLESDKPADEMQLALSRLTVEEKEPLVVGQ